jgi:hypothetical protein
MNQYWDNLRPFEKRLLVVVGTVLFIVLNWWQVVPHFSDWNRVKDRMAKAQKNLETFQKTIALKPTWETAVIKLQGEGLAVPPEEQLHHFDTAVTDQAIQSGVEINSKNKTQTHTNQYFMEQNQVIGVQSTETNLVNFLYNLGSGTSLIRVRDATLRPDPPHQRLNANLKLVASYQKNPTKAMTKAAAPATPPPAVTKPPVPAANPASASAKLVGKPDAGAPPARSPVPITKPLPTPAKKTQP